MTLWLNCFITNSRVPKPLQKQQYLASKTRLTNCFYFLSQRSASLGIVGFSNELEMELPSRLSRSADPQVQGIATVAGYASNRHWAGLHEHKPWGFHWLCQVSTITLLSLLLMCFLWLCPVAVPVNGLQRPWCRCCGPEVWLDAQYCFPFQWLHIPSLGRRI